MGRGTVRLVAGLAATLALLANAGMAGAAPDTSRDAHAVAVAAAKAPLDELVRDVEHEHPIAMFILAKRLFDAGRKDEAAFWFYEGQLRWRAIFAQDPATGAHGSVLRESEGDMFERLFDTIGPDINAYAAGDFPAMLKMYDAVLDWDLRHVDDFTPPGPAKDASRKGLQELAAYSIAHKDEILKARPQRTPGAPAVQADDAYTGSGGAMFGKPQEMLTPYEPAGFAAFKVGVTTKAQVVQALGAPEAWDTDEHQVSTLYYSYDRPLPVGGFSQRVSVSFAFDAEKRLAAVHLPDEK